MAATPVSLRSRPLTLPEPEPEAEAEVAGSSGAVPADSILTSSERNRLAVHADGSGALSPSPSNPPAVSGPARTLP